MVQKSIDAQTVLIMLQLTLAKIAQLGSYETVRMIYFRETSIGEI